MVLISALNNGVLAISPMVNGNTVLGGVDTQMKIAREETFGPVAPLFRFKDEDEAIRLANDTEYGLCAYFYSRDIGRVWRVAEALEYGIVGINAGVISTEVAPPSAMRPSEFAPPIVTTPTALSPTATTPIAFRPTATMPNAMRSTSTIAGHCVTASATPATAGIQ